MDKVKIDKFKNLLLTDRKEIIEDLMISNDNYSNLENDRTGDLVDKATNFYEKELLIGLSVSEQDALKKIDGALKKIEDNNYGLCESCSAEINEKRLEAIPYAALCMKCKSESNEKTKVRSDH